MTDTEMQVFQRQHMRFPYSDQVTCALPVYSRPIRIDVQTSNYLSTHNSK